MSELEEDSAAALARSASAGNSRTIEIALRVERHTLVRLSTIRATGKVVEHGMYACRSYLEYCAASEEAALHGCAVEVARAIRDEFCIGVLAIGVAAEAVDQFRSIGSPRSGGQHCHDCQILSRCSQELFAFHAALRMGFEWKQVRR